ncbi:NAD(P)/FAD-dependent oxidoreductase [Couchioplanes caeruleus]|uniref:Geranylgeranyl reductase n=2 Tax=Couchioplanes caeruleus TaxID=56438 RepID=A0A1K0F9X1_9ACTN|nr:NAD(P)/FAD-dependent oxidoreductase [Couchioplanes caeruleus]OJF09647.1 geranylgeranyl reductase [Couchioplanes caeruleus subsp. caeruleus]ROP31945.1 geranylgeranyl reductase family protein [Couchioplanes caeruleus]
MSYDVAIVGAGPAGSAAALAARRAGASVVLLDRADFPRDKPCGDGIAAEALDVLADLGVTGVTDGRPPVADLRLVAPGGTEVARPLPRPAYTVPRRIFDARLVAAAVRAGAELRRHTVRAIRRVPSGVVLDDRIEAGVVIGADGAGSVVRRALGHPANPHGHLAIAIRGYAPSDGAEQLIRTTRARWPAYAWSFPLGDGTANVGYGEVLRGTSVSRAYLLGRLVELLPGTAPTGLRAHHLPLSTHRPPPARGPVLLAGDALSLINPFTGEGIFYAVLSGTLAGTAAAGGPERAAARYTRALRARLGRHLRHSGLAALLTRQPRVVDAAVRAAGRDGAVFDRMVSLGLGDGVFDLRTIGRIGAEMARIVAMPS